MHRLRLALFGITVALAFAGVPALAASGEHGLEEVLIESASTPAQHKALANYFRGKAAEARQEAERHRSMAKTYAGTKSTMAGSQKEHCDKLAESYDAQAKQYDELAALHSEAK